MMNAPQHARRVDVIQCHVDAGLPNLVEEDLQLPTALRIQGRDYPPAYRPLDREFLLQQAARLAEPFQALSLNEYRSLPFLHLPSAARHDPRARAKAYYDSISQLAKHQDELAKFTRTLTTLTLCRKADPRKQTLTSSEQHFVAQHQPQLHPVSCPVLDVEQNAKESPALIEERITTALWNASRSLAFDTLNAMHSLVLARILGRIDWFNNDGCRFFYYENQILKSKRWPTMHVCEAVSATPRHVIVGGIRAEPKSRHLLRAIPTWLKRYVVLISGTKIKSSTVTADDILHRHLPACQIYCLAIGSYVFQGWTEADVPKFWS